MYRKRTKERFFASLRMTEFWVFPQPVQPCPTKIWQLPHWLFSLWGLIFRSCWRLLDDWQKGHRLKFVLLETARIVEKHRRIGGRIDESEVHVRKCGGETMLATFAFDVCHDVYRVAREAIDTKIPTLNLEASGKYQWSPDRMPRLAEYVCDFARAGERALGFDALEKRSKAGGAEACPTLFR